MEISKAIIKKKRQDLFNFFSANCLISLRRKYPANSNKHCAKHSPKDICPKWWWPRTVLQRHWYGTTRVVFSGCFLVFYSYHSVLTEGPFPWSVSYSFVLRKATSSKGTIPQSNNWDHPDNQITSLGNSLRKWANNLTAHKQIISDCYKECCWGGLCFQVIIFPACYRKVNLQPYS